MSTGQIAVKTFSTFVTHTYFRDIQIVNAENIPKDGPVIICGNHSNQFVDAMMIMSHVPRPVKFLVAAVSMKRPIIGNFAHQAGGIAVQRAQDLAKVGAGKIVSVENNIVRGVGTKFTSQAQEGGSISVKEIKLDVPIVKIRSDTELEVKADEKTEVRTGLNADFKLVPKLDQAELYNNVWSALNDDQCIGIFPEGGSHDRTDLIPLKAGVCIMALGAMAK